MNSNEHIIRTYETASGRKPFTEWLSALKDKEARLRILRRIERLKLGNFGDSKSIGAGVQELRFHFGSGYRVYYMEIDHIIVVLLCGGDKGSQSKDIEKAKEYAKDLRNRTHD